MSASDLCTELTFGDCESGCIVKHIDGLYFDGGVSGKLSFRSCDCSGDILGSGRYCKGLLWKKYTSTPRWFGNSNFLTIWFITGPICEDHGRCESCKTISSSGNKVGRIFGIKETISSIFKGTEPIKEEPVSSIICYRCAKEIKDSLQKGRNIRLTLGALRMVRNLTGDFSSAIG